MPTNLLRGVVGVIALGTWSAFVLLSVLGLSTLTDNQFQLMLVGLAAVTAPVLQFCFGGSQSSDRKTELLAQAPPVPPPGNGVG